MGKDPEDLRPEWLNIARRLQSKARGRQPGLLLMRIDILVDMEGNPIIWSKPDKERADGLNIRIITERELRYFIQIAEHLGSAARYQFLAEFLHGQKIPGLSNTTVPAIRGKLGGNYFYCFLTTPKQLLKISFINHRSLNDPEGIPTYQRLVSQARMK